MLTTCENCQRDITLTTLYEDDFLIGDECVCGYWVSRYTEEDYPYEDLIEDFIDEGYYYSGTGELSTDDSYIDYLNR